MYCNLQFLQVHFYILQYFEVLFYQIIYADALFLEKNKQKVGLELKFNQMFLQLRIKIPLQIRIRNDHKQLRIVLYWDISLHVL